MRTPASFCDFDSIDAQAEQLTGFDQRYQQLDAGPYSGSFLAAASSELSLFVETTNRSLHQEGAGPPDQLSIVALLGGGPPGIVNGMALEPDDLLLVGPGGSYDAVLGPGTIPVVLGWARQALALPLREVVERARGQVLKLSAPGRSARLEGAVQKTVRSWEAEDGSVDLPTEALTEWLQDLFSSVGSRACLSHPSWELFRRARSVLVANLEGPMTVSGLAEAVGSSRRRLEYAFERCVGVGPGRFRKILRLNRARRTLESGSDSVTEAAFEVGIDHLGRFSGDYRHLFGECPSETLRRARSG